MGRKNEEESQKLVRQKYFLQFKFLFNLKKLKLNKETDSVFASTTNLGRGKIATSVSQTYEKCIVAYKPYNFILPTPYM